MSHSQGMDATMRTARPAIEQEAPERFAFLVSAKGIVQSPVRKGYWATELPFAAEHVGIEVNLDFRDESVDLYLVRLQNGAIPPDGFVDLATHEPIRRSIELYLRDVARVQDEAFDQLMSLQRTPKPWTFQTASDILHHAQQVLERYVDLLLSQPVSALFPTRERRLKP